MQRVVVEATDMTIYGGDPERNIPKMVSLQTVFVISGSNVAFVIFSRSYQHLVPVML